MRDVVHPLVEDRPVARAGDVGCGGGRLEAAHERGEVGVVQLAQQLRKRLVDVRAERQHATGQRQAVEERPQLRRLGAGAGRHLVQVARELAADLLEDLAVAAR